MWHVYNLIHVSDSVKTTTIRKVRPSLWPPADESDHCVLLPLIGCEGRRHGLHKQPAHTADAANRGGAGELRPGAVCAAHQGQEHDGESARAAGRVPHTGPGDEPRFHAVQVQLGRHGARAHRDGVQHRQARGASGRGHADRTGTPMPDQGSHDGHQGQDRKQHPQEARRQLGPRQVGREVLRERGALHQAAHRLQAGQVRAAGQSGLRQGGLLQVHDGDGRAPGR